MVDFLRCSVSSGGDLQVGVARCHHDHKIGVSGGHLEPGRRR